jgi:hypothetical protein
MIIDGKGFLSYRQTLTVLVRLTRVPKGHISYER